MVTHSTGGNLNIVCIVQIPHQINVNPDSRPLYRNIKGPNMSFYVIQKDYQINTMSTVAGHVSISRIFIADINLPRIHGRNRKKRIPYICETKPFFYHCRQATIVGAGLTPALVDHATEVNQTRARPSLAPIIFCAGENFFKNRKRSHFPLYRHPRVGGDP